MLLSETINETQFIGMNDRYPSEILPPGLFTYISNAYVDDNSLSKRKGNTSIATSLGAHTVLGGSAFEPNGGTKQIVINLDGASNSQLYKWTGGATFTAIGSANITKLLPMYFTQASNYLFGFNGTDVVDYDGTTVTKNRATIPIGKFSFWFHNYLFVAGVAGYPNRVYWSDLGVPTTFTPANFIDVNANDGDFITGLNAFNDNLLVFKNNSMWGITGFDGSTFSTQTIAGQNTTSILYGFGTPSHLSVVAAGHNLYYLSFVGGVPHFRSLERTAFGNILDAGVVSFDIEGTMANLNKSALSMVAGTYDGRRLRWAVPSGSSAYNNVVLVLRPDLTLQSALGTHNSWVRHDGITPGQYIVSTISGRAKTYWTDGSGVGIVNESETSVYSDNGTAVSLDIRTRDYLVDVARSGKFKYVFPKYKSGSAGVLKVNARIDDAVDFGLQKSISMTGRSPGLGPTGTFTLGESTLGGSTTVRTAVTLKQLTGSLLGLQFTEATANSCDIYEYQIIAMKKGLRTSN